MHSILYVADGQIHRLGPFDSEDKAFAAAVRASDAKEFDIEDQWVIYLGPQHQITELNADDLAE
jgi:hypothetical protein